MMRWEAADDNISDTVVLSERLFDRKGLQRLVAPLTEAFCLLAAAFASGRRHAAAKRGWPDFVCFREIYQCACRTTGPVDMKSSNWMHCLASFKLYVFHEVVVCFNSVATLLTFGFPMFSQIQVSGRLCPGRQAHHIQILKNVQNLYDRRMQDVYCIHVFLSLLMIYLQQSRQSMSKACMCVCLFVCWGSFSESHLLECECNSTSYTSSSRKLSRLVTWLNSQSSVCCLMWFPTQGRQRGFGKSGIATRGDFDGKTQH